MGTPNVLPVFVKDPYTKSVAYTNSDTAPTKKDLVPAADVPAEGLRLDHIPMTSTDTANRAFRFYDHDGSTSYLIGAVVVTALAGTDGTVAAVDGMATLSPTLGYYILMTGHKLQVENVATLTAAKEVDITARGGKQTA